MLNKTIKIMDSIAATAISKDPVTFAAFYGALGVSMLVLAAILQ